MRFGICCGPGSFVPSIQRDARNQTLDSLPALMELLQAAGADFVEFGVGAVSPDAGEAEFESLQKVLARFSLRVEAFNSFIPAAHRITGPDVHFDSLLRFCRVALRRCKALGGDVVVLGSGLARKIPEGFDPVKGLAQFAEFCRALGPIAEEAGIDIALEPLNTREDNLLTSVRQGAELVDQLSHPRIKLLADLFHIAVDKEPLENVTAAGKRLKHTHVADLGRAAPGFATSGEEDFIGFFRSLRKAGYDGRCSFEGSFTDIDRQGKPVIEFLKRRWAESAFS